MTYLTPNTLHNNIDTNLIYKYEEDIHINKAVTALMQNYKITASIN
jgi:hypothetical protein